MFDRHEKRAIYLLDHGMPQDHMYAYGKLSNLQDSAHRLASPKRHDFEQHPSMPEGVCRCGAYRPSHRKQWRVKVRSFFGL